MPQDGSLLTNEQLMNMPMMMPMMMDGSAMLNMPQNGITKGMVSDDYRRTKAYKFVQTRSHSMIAR